MNFFWLMAEEIRGYMAALGVRRFDDLIGRAGELLEMDRDALHYKSRGLDLTKMLTPAPELEGGVLPAGSTQIETRKVHEQDHGLDSPSLLDLIMLEQVDLPFLEPGRTAGGGAALLPPGANTNALSGVEMLIALSVQCCRVTRRWRSCQMIQLLLSSKALLARASFFGARHNARCDGRRMTTRASHYLAVG